MSHLTSPERPPASRPAAPGRTAAAALAGRALWTLVDQVLVSASTMLMSVLIARSVSANSFGAFSLAFAVFALSVVVTRAVAGRPVSVRFAGRPLEDFVEAARSSAGTALATGLMLGAASVGAGLLAGGELGRGLIAIGVVLPGLLVQDNWRLVLVAQGRVRRAVVTDGTWAAGQTAGALALAHAGVDEAYPYILAWGASAALAAVVGVVLSGAPPRLRSTRSWMSAHRDLTWFLLAEVLLLQGTYQGVLVLVGTFGDLADAGVLRAAQVVLGPVMLVSQSAQAFLLPELARRTGLDPRRRLLAGTALSAALSVVAASYGAAVLLLPDPVGRQLLGVTWEGTRDVLPVSIAAQVAVMAAMGAACVLYSLGRARATFAISVTTAALMAVGGPVGLAVGGVLGAAAGLGLANVIALPLWWRAAVRWSHTAPTASTAPTAPAAP